MKKYLTLKNLGWLLTVIVVLMLGNSGMSKIISTEEMVKGFEFMKLSNIMLPLGIAEVLCVIGLVIPKLTRYSVILITGIMGGAVSVHMTLMGGAGVMAPISVLLLAWSAYCLRFHTN